MLTVMPEKRKKGRPRGRRPSVTIQVRVHPDLAEALLRSAEFNRRTRNTELILALEAYLRSGGFWPPKP